MRENTLQLLIFSLVTFPSTEFKVKSTIDKVVAMVGDRRKRVRHSALDTLAVLAQIYESEVCIYSLIYFIKLRILSLRYFLFYWPVKPDRFQRYRQQNFGIVFFWLRNKDD